MPANRIMRRKVEVYARTLFEFAGKADTEAQAYDALRRFVSLTQEVRSTVLALCELGKADLVEGLADAYAELERGVAPKGALAFVARTLRDAARAEGHEQRVREDLAQLAVLTPEVLDVLGVMGTGSDSRLLGAVAEQYKRILDDEGKTVAVSVTTAIPLDAELRSAVREKMTKELDKPVYLMESVDPAIIGGIVLSVGGQLRDASVRAQLENLHKTLTTSTTGGEASDGKD